MVQDRPKVTIISLCKYKILEEEYVKPLERIFEKFAVVKTIHYKDLKEKDLGNIVILSGTAIKDFEYLNYLDKFQWIKDFNGKIFGICAGSQIVTLLFGGKLENKELIGVFSVKLNDKTIRSYFLATRIPILNENFEVLGTVKDVPAIFKVKNREIYGFLFHPEVLNEELFTLFVMKNL